MSSTDYTPQALAREATSIARSDAKKCGIQYQGRSSYAIRIHANNNVQLIVYYRGTKREEVERESNFSPTTYCATELI